MVMGLSTQRENMMLAVDAYVSRVDKCKCGDTVIRYTSLSGTII